MINNKLYFVVIVIFCLVFLPCSSVLAASKNELRQELKMLGNMIGYSLGCATQVLGKNMKDPEQQQFVQRVFPKYKPLGSDAVKLFDYSVREGMLAIGASGGKQCSQSIEALIAKYESVGLTGNAYKPVLQGRVAPNTSTPHSDSSGNAKCSDKILGTKTISGKYLGWFESEDGPFTIGIKLDTGEEVFIISSQDEAEKYFGTGSGQRISATYKVEQMWLEEVNECFRSEVLYSGKVIQATSNTSDIQQSESYIGYVEDYQEVGMSFLRLKDSQEREVLLLGAAFEVEGSLGECVNKALEGEYPIEIVGTVDGNQILIKNETVTCRKYTGQ